MGGSVLLVNLTPYYELWLIGYLLTYSYIGGESGGWWFPENVVSINLISISVLITLLVSLGEESNTLVQLSKVVCLLSILFFGCSNLLTIFLLFELTMVHIYVMILIQGSQPEKISAVYYALAYTSVFSLPFLSVVINVATWPLRFYPSPITQVVVMGIFMAKSPLYGLHGWLPNAHVEAPTSGSILLAGLLLKVGLYGAIKFIILSISSTYLISLLSVVGISLGALLAATSSESKVLAAYSSVAHINLGIYGISLFSGHLIGGSYLLCLSHGYISLIVFYLVGTIYHQMGTRILYYSSGLLSFSGAVSVVVTMVFLSNGGIPPTLSFWAELLIITGISCFNLSTMVIVTVYFIVGLYYSVYAIVHINKPGGVLNLTQIVLPSCMWGLLIVCNVIAIIN